MEGGVPNSEENTTAKHPHDVPEPPITKYDEQLYRDLCQSHILDGQEKDCFWQPIIVAKNRIVHEHGSQELVDRLAQYWDSHCYRGNYLPEYKKMLEEAYEQVVREYKEHHKNQLPWHDDDDDDDEVIIIIPDPPIDDMDIKLADQANVNPLSLVKFEVIQEHGPEEIKKKLNEWNREKEAPVTWDEAVDKAYREVIRQYKEEHNQQLPWEEEEE